MTVYQEELRKVGIGLNLRLVTPETLFKLVMDRNFTMVSMAWGALLFPNPETSFGSSLADQANNNNITGFKSARVDELLKQYEHEYDQKKRAAIIQEVDGLTAAEYPYLLSWTPVQRIAYWTGSHAGGYLTRIGDYRDIPSLCGSTAEGCGAPSRHG